VRSTSLLVTLTFPSTIPCLPPGHGLTGVIYCMSSMSRWMGGSPDLALTDLRCCRLVAGEVE
jgi:hypothetical protein